MNATDHVTLSVMGQEAMLQGAMQHVRRFVQRQTLCYMNNSGHDDMNYHSSACRWSKDCLGMFLSSSQQERAQMIGKLLQRRSMTDLWGMRRFGGLI